MTTDSHIFKKFVTTNFTPVAHFHSFAKAGVAGQQPVVYSQYISIGKPQNFVPIIHFFFVSRDILDQDVLLC